MKLQANWTSYSHVTKEGSQKQLLKLYAQTGSAKITRARLLTKAELEIESIKAPNKLNDHWSFGFWVPADKRDAEYHLAFELQNGETTILTITPGDAPVPYAYPVRLDQLDGIMEERMINSESTHTMEGLIDTPDMEQYVRQHNIFYEKPAEHWSQGLFYGNGSVGAVSQGVSGESQTYFLDDCSLWGTTKNGTPFGRFYAGDFCIRYNTDAVFSQTLDLYHGKLITHDGDLLITSYADANEDVFVFEVENSGNKSIEIDAHFQKTAIVVGDVERAPLLARACGSWRATTGEEEFNKNIEYINSLERSDLSVTENSVINEMPNMKVAVTLHSPQAIKVEVEGHSASLSSTIPLGPGETVSVFVAIATITDETTSIENALSSNRESIDRVLGNDAEHNLWWEDLWNKSFIEVPDKMIENLWYHGVYHQAVISRSKTAVSFMGLYHPIDHRTWQDAYTTDAQTEMVFYAPYTTNHLEQLYPMLNTYAKIVCEMLIHTPSEGACVTQQVFPAWAGLADGFAYNAQHDINVSFKGSTAWNAIMFWRYYTLTMDKKHLAGVVYPVLAASADYCFASLHLRSDGKYSIKDSACPEQAFSDVEGVYDRCLFEALFTASIEAATLLGDDPARSADWDKALNNLWDYHADEETVHEAKDLEHPYRCHPVVMFPIHPANTVEPGDALWDKLVRTYDVVTKVFAFHYEDRHGPIVGTRGGVEPNGHAAGFLMNAAARCKGWDEVKRILYAVVCRTQLKRNGLRSISDPRHGGHLTHLAIAEAVSGQASGISECLLHDFKTHARIFANLGKGVFRFSGMRLNGGFLVAGEYRDVTQKIVVKSLCGNDFIIQNPWQDGQIECNGDTTYQVLADGTSAICLKTEVGKVYTITKAGQANVTMPDYLIEERCTPRKIVCGDFDDFSPSVQYYPVDLEFAQPSDGQTVYLGMPKDEPNAFSTDRKRAERMAESDDAKQRQTAARFLSRFEDADATEALIRLASDEDLFTAYSAAVCLVKQGTMISLRAALRIAHSSAYPHQKREVYKAISRLAKTDKGRALLPALLSDFKFLQEIYLT